MRPEKYELSRIADTFTNYTKVYKDIINIGTPNRLETLFNKVGLTILSNKLRLKRLKKALKEVNNLKRQAVYILTAAITSSKTTVESAANLNKKAIGTIIREEPHLELAELKIEFYLNALGETIEFVQQNAHLNYPPTHIAWSKLNLLLVEEVTKSDLRKKVRIQEEWKMYVDTIREWDSLRRNLIEQEKLVEWSYFLENLGEQLVYEFEEELKRIEDRFELLKILITTNQLSELERFFQWTVDEVPLLRFEEQRQLLLEAVDEKERFVAPDSE